MIEVVKGPVGNTFPTHSFDEIPVGAYYLHEISYQEKNWKGLRKKLKSNVGFVFENSNLLTLNDHLGNRYVILDVEVSINIKGIK